MARALVTGATGFIGRNLVESLVRRGDHVTCLVHRRGSEGFFSPLSVEYHRGDLLIQGALDPILGKVDTVYHLGGATLVLSPEDFFRGNAEGTRLLAEACARQHRPPTIVYVSSLAAAGPARGDQPVDEKMPPTPVSAYGRSKIAAEAALRAVAGDVPATVVRPSCVFGPWDRLTLFLFKQVRMGFNLNPGKIDFRLAWIHVDDLLAGLIQAAERGERLLPDNHSPDPGQGIYYMAMEEAPTHRQASEVAARIMNRRLRQFIYMPAALCRWLARINDRRARLIGRPLLMSSDKVAEALAGSWICSSEKAKHQLGFSCRLGFEDGLRQVAKWYRDHDWL